METLTLNVPTMYGDHHVIEVRQILLALPGIKDVYASSSFGVVQANIDPAQVDETAITAALAAAGYLEEITVPLETGEAAYKQDKSTTFFRHSTAYEQTQHVVTFSQQTLPSGKALWPCPGMGPVRMLDEE